MTDPLNTAAIRAAYAKCNEFGWPADIRALCDEIDALRAENAALRAERERYVAESEEIVAYANALRARLAEVEALHFTIRRPAAYTNVVGDFCAACGEPAPCPTFAAARGEGDR